MSPEGSSRERTKWSRQRVVAAIRERFVDGQPMQCATSEDHRLYQAVRRYFGSWEEAMRAAGRTPVRTRWSPERVVARLRKGYPRHGCRVWDDSRLRSAAGRYFGGRHAALRAAGFRVPRRKPLRRKRTTEELLAAIRERHDRGVLKATIREDTSLYHGARNRFGSWGRAVRAAGLPFGPTWTREAVLAEIRERHRRGDALDPPREDRSLLRGAQGRFGSWLRAVRAAGFSAPDPHRWTRETIIAELRGYLVDGRLTGMWRERRHLYYAALRLFGGWPAVVAELGLRLRSRRRRWSRERVLVELERRVRAGDESGVSLADPPLAAAARHHLGSLTAAWQALGVEPPRRRTWDARRVIEVLQDRHVRGLPVGRPLDGGPSLRNAAVRYHGGWRSALVAAGLGEYFVPLTPYLTREEVLDAIRRLPHAEGQMTTPSTRVPELCRAARRHFGTWCRAVDAAGRRPLRRSWGRVDVIEEIRTLHDEGASLNSADHPNLVRAARRFYPGWHDALRAAGIHVGGRDVA